MFYYFYSMSVIDRKFIKLFTFGVFTIYKYLNIQKVCLHIPFGCNLESLRKFLEDIIGKLLYEK